VGNVAASLGAVDRGVDDVLDTHVAGGVGERLALADLDVGSAGDDQDAEHGLRARHCTPNRRGVVQVAVHHGGSLPGQ
jgi:hypothetical protein